MWDLPRPGIEPASPALADGFLTTAPPGKCLPPVFFEEFNKSALCGPPNCLLLPQGLNSTDPGTPLCSSLPPASNLFSSRNLRISHSAILAQWDQPAPLFGLNSLLPINHELPDSSELFQRGGGRRQPPGQHASAGLLHLPLSGVGPQDAPSPSSPQLRTSGPLRTRSPSLSCWIVRRRSPHAWPLLLLTVFPAISSRRASLSTGRI